MLRIAACRIALLLSILSVVGACSEDPAQPTNEDEVAVLEFDGTDDYVQVADAAALDLTSNVTLIAWYYFSGGLVGEPGIIQKDGPSSFGRYGLWALGDKVDFCIFLDGGSQQCMYSTGSLTVNAWNHIAGVYDGSEMRTYLNGVLDSSQQLTGAISTSTHPLYIEGDPTESRYLAGRLHEVQVWSVARTAAQIATGMDTHLNGNEPGLVGYWPMDEGSGQTVFDKSVNNLHGTLGSGGNADASDPAWATAIWPH